VRRPGGSVEVQVLGVLMDEDTKSPVVVLRAVEGEETLPIRIGMPEAAAIAAVLEEVELPRPLTHDLFLQVVEGLKAHLLGAEVTDLRDETYFAVLKVRLGRRTLSFDARPSDAIALCLRAHAPIRVAAAVFRKAEPRDVTEASRRQWLGFLRSLEAAADPSGTLQKADDDAAADEGSAGGGDDDDRTVN
jgi:uncharacterized protein